MIFHQFNNSIKFALTHIDEFNDARLILFHAHEDGTKK